MKRLISVFTLLVLKIKIKKERKGNNKNRAMSLLINLKKIILEKCGG
jgi:hypothetical protein